MFRDTSALLLLPLLLTTTLRSSDAHRSLPQGVTCGSQFNSSDTALTVPNPAVSWASYRIFTCDEPVFWLEAEAVEGGQTLHFTATVPVLDRFAGARITAALIGPGLPALTTDTDTSNVPQDVVTYAEENGHGVSIYKSPEDQSTCDHLQSEAMSAESEVVDGRCHFYERFGGEFLFLQLLFLLRGKSVVNILTFPIFPFTLQVLILGSSWTKMPW